MNRQHEPQLKIKRQQWKGTFFFMKRKIILGAVMACWLLVTTISKTAYEMIFVFTKISIFHSCIFILYGTLMSPVHTLYPTTILG